MKVIGLTGSIGMGKTTAANMLRDMGIPVHCSDQAVHDLIAPGGAAVAIVAETFPDAYDRKSGGIDRKKLGAAVFGDNEKKEQLEAILHPMVQASQQKFLREQQARGCKIAVLDIPLLYETGAEKRLDYVMVVSAPALVQKQRVMARPGMTEEKFNAILKNQIPDEEKKQRADFVIPTGLGLAYTRAELQKVINKLRKGPSIKNESNRFPPHNR